MKIYLKNQINNYYDIVNRKANYYNQMNSANNYNTNNINYNTIKNNNFSFKNLLKFIFSIGLTFFIVFVILNIPFVHNLLLSLFNNDFPILFVIVLFILFYISKNR